MAASGRNVIRRPFQLFFVSLFLFYFILFLIFTFLYFFILFLGEATTRAAYKILNNILSSDAFALCTTRAHRRDAQSVPLLNKDQTASPQVTSRTPL